ncbi:MAG: SMC-Scp complex subunit ScpB [Ardenticatenaceae bacterium]|nr:SMC-Scp complex subunit ScpB [Ardenticatenaceae bacterium]HBY95687.1 SMC-Scp complex subunit ScpB [Chloroflexota bacterium]
MSEIPTSPVPAVPCDDPVALSVPLETLLFVAEVPVSPETLAQALECSPEAVVAGLQTLSDRLAATGLRLQYFRGRVQLVTAPELAPFVERFLGLDLSSKLSTAALETLAIIAYRQPVTRLAIDEIRGVNSGGVLRTLLARELVEEVGRLDTVGHPILYGTTFQFLRYFGLSSLDELPPLDLEAAARLLSEVAGNT